jgi:hypothetical protein
LLNRVAQRRRDARQTQVPAQALIRDDVNACDLRRAEIEWNVVGLSVVKCG